MGTKEEEKVNRADNLIPHNSDIFEDDNRAKRWKTIYIAGTPIRKEDAHVRLTSEAYALLTEKAKAYNVSQKEIASEAISLLVKSEKKDKEYLAHLKRLQEKIKSLQENVAHYILFGVGLGLFIAFVIVIILGGMS